MPRDGLQRLTKEVELFRRFVRVNQEAIEILDELHPLLLQEAKRKSLAEIREAFRSNQLVCIQYLQVADNLIEKMDAHLGEFTRAENDGQRIQNP